jgi:4-aminobutyrate aminotransferase-like enzyme
VLSRRVVEMIDDARWLTFSTWRGHTLSLAAMRATLRALDEGDLVERARVLGGLVARRLDALRAAHPELVRVAGDGLLWNLDVDGPDRLQPSRWRGEEAADSPAGVVWRAALEHGVMLRPMGALSLWMMPPLTVSESQLDAAMEGIDRALTDFRRHY